MTNLLPTEIALQDEVQRLQIRVAALERERQIQAAILDKAPAMISIVRAPDFVYEFVNPAFQALAPGKQFIGRRFADVWAGVSDPLVEILQHVVETGETFRLEDSPYTIQRGPGAPPEVVYVTYSWIPLAGPDGKPDRIFTFAHETTASVRQRQAGQAVRESSDRAALVQQIARAGSFDLDLAANVVVWSEELQQLYGIGPGEPNVNMEDWVQWILPEDRERVAADFAAGLAAGELTTQFRIHRRDTGEVRWLEGGGGSCATREARRRG